MLIEIVAHNSELPPGAQADIRARVEHMSRYYDRIVSCRVVIDVPQRRRQADADLYGIRIALKVPGGEVVVNRQPRESLATALDNAFNAVRRRLQDHARRQRGAVKAHAPTGRE